MNNRQAGRRRGRGGQRQGGNPGRQDNGNRIDNRARGNAAQLLEKYKNLATDAQRSGDRVSTEYYLQFADHYFRVLAETRSRMEENGQPRRNRDDEDDAEGVEDFGFEGDLGSPAHYHQQPVQQQQDSDRDDRPRRDNARDRDGNQSSDRDRDRDDRPRQRDDQPRQREDQPRQRDDQQREVRPRRDRESSNEDRPRRERDTSSEDRPRREREAPAQTADAPRPRRDREASNDVGEDRPRSEPRIYGREAVAEPRDERPVAANDEPRRRGRPRREPVAEVESEGFDTAVLPPAISVEVAPPSDEAAPPRPRRGRPPRVRNDDEVVPPAA